MNCPNCKTTALAKVVDGHPYEVTQVEEDYAKSIAAYPTSSDTMRMKAAMYELQCETCHTVYTFCIGCKRFIKHNDLHRVTKPKWEHLGGSLERIDGMFIEYLRCPFCGYSVGGVRERIVDAQPGDEFV